MKFVAVLQRILPPAWLGMLIAMAMEAQLKFQAPGITRELGLGIGKIVFTWLNRAECALAILLLGAFFISKTARRSKIIFSLILLILIAQSFWLIPNLIERINLIVSGQTPPNSLAHLFYIGFEVLKMCLLLFLSVLLNLQNADSPK